MRATLRTAFAAAVLALGAAAALPSPAAAYGHDEGGYGGYDAPRGPPPWARRRHWERWEGPPPWAYRPAPPAYYAPGPAYALPPPISYGPSVNFGFGLR